ncbi:MAG: hypothetical protein ACRYFU_12405 [Janthinobacterium lividum]
MADSGVLDPAGAAAIERVPGVTRRGTRLGNWLTKEQANDLLNAPDRRPWPASVTAPSSPCSLAAVPAGRSCCA